MNNKGYAIFWGGGEGGQMMCTRGNAQVAFSSPANCLFLAT